VDIAVIRLPRIANFDDFTPLATEPGVRVRYVQAPAALGQPDAVILPGTKSTMADLAWLRAQGLDEAIRALAAQGKAVVGICGGYQMLGRDIQDPDGVEGALPQCPGLDLLPVHTLFAGDKATHQAEARLLGGPGWLATLGGQTVRGYEIHMGQTTGARPWLEITRRSGAAVALGDGAVAAQGRVWGCYLHGLFANEALRHAWLATLGWQETAGAQAPGAELQAALDRLADQVEASLDMSRLEAMVWGA
jgi:adenosylcobyric acid synthase